MADQFEPGRQTPSVPSVERVLSILEVIANSQRGLSLREICRKVQLPRSSCHCLIVTLERRGYLLHNRATHRYLVGTKLFGLGDAALKGITLREQAAPFVHDLMTETGLTVHLAILDHATAVVVDKVAPPGLLQLATWVGKRFDLHCSGVGKALLAFLPEAEFHATIDHHGLTRYNENTITSSKRLLKEIASIRHQGFALEDEEGELGFRCIGAPIFDQSGAAIAAVSIAGSIHQITDANLSLRSKQVMEAARNISAIVSRNRSRGPMTRCL
jgi:DNA-binding IclR family transcriptional regulator